MLRNQERLCVSDVDGLRETILMDYHGSLYFIYTGDTKMYRDLCENDWWNEMKKGHSKLCG